MSKKVRAGIETGVPLRYVMDRYRVAFPDPRSPFITLRGNPGHCPMRQDRIWRRPSERLGRTSRNVTPRRNRECGVTPHERILPGGSSPVRLPGRSTRSVAPPRRHRPSNSPMIPDTARSIRTRLAETTRREGFRALRALYPVSTGDAFVCGDLTGFCEQLRSPHRNPRYEHDLSRLWFRGAGWSIMSFLVSESGVQGHVGVVAGVFAGASEIDDPGAPSDGMKWTCDQEATITWRLRTPAGSMGRKGLAGG